MDDWSENARLIVESARGVVPPGDLSRIRRCRFSETGFSRDALRNMTELGWLLLRVGESAGGLGLGLRELCELMRVLGRGLVPEPLLSGILAARLLGQHLPESVSEGREVAVTAWQDAPGSLSWRGGQRNGVLDGRKVHVPGAAGADLFVVLTGAGIAVVARDAPGLTIETVEMQDGCRFGTLAFDRVPAAFQEVEDADAALDEATLAHSAYLLGLSERALEMTIDYLGMRKQFDRPVGSFQALQHRASEIKIRLELSRAAILATAGRMDRGAEPSVRIADVSRTKAGAGDLAMLVAREAVQMHGAIGFTDEADIGLYARKAMTEASHFGAARLHRQRYLEALEGMAA